MDGDLKVLKKDLEQLQQGFETHRGDMVLYMDKQTDLLTQVVGIQTKQQEHEKSTDKLFEIYSKLSDRVRNLEIAGAGGQVKMASNERLIWFIATLLVGAAGIGRMVFGG